VCVVRIYNIYWYALRKFTAIFDVFYGNLMSRDTFGQHQSYETDRRFTLKFILIYAVFVHVLCLKLPEPELSTVVCAWFSRRNSGHICRYKTNRRFTYDVLVPFSRWNPPEIEPAHDRDFHAVIFDVFYGNLMSRDTFGPHHSYETYRRFTLKFILIHVVFVHDLCLKMPELELSTVVCAQFSRRNSGPICH
jgi:hypothetical protein